MIERVSSLLNLSDFAMPYFRFNSFLDIALIAFATYKILGWVRQTRAWSVFKGILMLAVIYLAANLLQLHTTTWLIEQTVTWAVIALMIIFQPELRTALERLGKGRRLPFIGTLGEAVVSNSSHTMNEIVEAAVKLAKTKTGGLVVIEQQVVLGDLATTGIILDAVVSSQLLVSIFENTSPLHDGAVLIRSNRVNAAMCILPLTEAKLATELGTRHRAAVGLSETCDAYVLVVSEETGSLSIAHDSKLYRDLSENQLRDMLLSNIKPSKRGKSNKSGKKRKK
jgi:diadenylate cyclase